MPKKIRGAVEDTSAPDPDVAVPSAAAAQVPAEGATARAPVSEELKAVVEALIFASPDPITPRLLGKILDGEPKEDIEAAVAALKDDYDQRRGLQLVEVAGGYQIVTRSELHEWVRRLFHEQTKTKLSVQALETLAVIAYKQPVTAPEIAEVRGVNTAGVISTLLERRLIKIAGRKQVVGRPFLYATTREFLVRFGLKDLSELPKVEDMAEILGLEGPLTLSDSQPASAPLPFDEVGVDLVPDPDDGEPSESVH